MYANFKISTVEKNEAEKRIGKMFATFFLLSLPLQLWIRYIPMHVFLFFIHSGGLCL